MSKSSWAILSVAACLAAALAIFFWPSSNKGDAAEQTANTFNSGRAHRSHQKTGEPTTAPRHKVYVEVIAADHTPLAAAAVKVIALAQTRDGTTDADGLVTFDGISRRVIRVEISARGYVTKKVTPAPLTDATPEVSWTFKLERDPNAPEADQNAVTGAVVCEGKPVVGATVFAVRGEDEIQSASDVKRTDATGRFVIPVSNDETKRPEITKLVALHRAHGEAEVVFTGVDVVISLPPGGFIEGKVISRAGPLPDRVNLQAVPTFAREHPLIRKASKQVRRALRRNRKDQTARELKMVLDHLMRGKSVRLSSVLPEGKTDDTAQPGAFRLGPLAASKTDLVASAKGFEPDSAIVQVVQGETKKNVVLTLQAPLTITGVVTDADTGEPLKRVQIYANTRGARGGQFAQAKTDKDGRYTLQTHAEERHTISASKKGYLAFDVGGIIGDNGDSIVRDIELRPLKKGGNGRRGHSRDYVGIGAQLKKTEGGVLVQKIFTGGAAAEHLNKGDIIVQVDGEWLEDIPLGIAVESILGEDGTEVELVIRRKGKKRGDTESILLQRRRIQAGGG